MANPDKSFFSNGKLLLSAEYLVMHGALALAMPINQGQHLEVYKTENQNFNWIAKQQENLWFYCELNPHNLELISTDNENLASRFVEILWEVIKLNPAFADEIKGKKVISKLEFNPDFGFGSSSTLINNIANWAKINPYQLLKNTFGGSGYDIACASARKPIFYELINGKPNIEETDFNPAFADNLYFVWQGQKQSSLKSITEFNRKKTFTKEHISYASGLSREMQECDNLNDFMKIIDEHENFMSGILGKRKVKEAYFPDFEGSIKSLGAWGGDFVLMATTIDNIKLKKYLQTKNMEVVYKFNELKL